MPDLQFKTLVNVEIKEDGDSGTVVAEFAAFDEVDRDREITAKGAFGEQNVLLGAYGHASTGMHGVPTAPVGTGKITEKDGKAIFTGTFNLKMVAGRETFEAVKMAGALQQWSYGFRVVKESVKQIGRDVFRVLEQLSVHEVSPVMVGAANASRTVSVKSLEDLDDTTPLAEHSDAVLDAAKDVLSRFTSLAEMRGKQGRVLSSANVARLTSLQSTVADVGAEIAKLLEDADPQDPDDAEVEAGKAAYVGFLRSQAHRPSWLAVA